MSAQKPVYGPVISAYLTGLREELNELDFQLRQQEISRADYERTRQRLLILRRLVQERAKQSRADVLPELQVLQLEEFGMVGLSQPPEPERLKPGNVFDDSWRLLSIEPTKPPFYIFEKVPLTPVAAPEAMRERHVQRQFNPSEVIETIVVPDPPSFQPMASRPRNVTPPLDETAEPAAALASPQQLVAPRMLHFFLPEFTERAREKALEGEVIVSATFRRDGQIKDTVVEKSLGFGLDERAVEALKRASFEPARMGERSLDARAEVVFSFKLSKVSARLRNATALQP
ncbi:MAG: TonB family protein [Acidobacteria bacterium]|nr:TonB family protein [Acidobacteriota bacterium]MBI3425721.1 TonB family protein [Acidobacteriota bacterium]